MGFEPTIFLPHWKCGAITRFRSPMPLKSQYRWDFTHTVLTPIETVLLLRTTCNMNSDVTKTIHTHAFMHWHSLLYYYTKSHTNHIIGFEPTQPRLFGNIHCLLSPRMHSFYITYNFSSRVEEGLVFDLIWNGCCGGTRTHSCFRHGLPATFVSNCSLDYLIIPFLRASSIVSTHLRISAI